MEEENKEYIISKINTKNFYKVYRSTYNGKDFYSLLISQKSYDDTETYYYKGVNFKKGLPLPQNDTLIRIKRAVENYYGEKYKPVSSYMILEYETKQTEEQKKESAYEEYSQTLMENEENREIKISDSDLPF